MLFIPCIFCFVAVDYHAGILCSRHSWLEDFERPAEVGVRQAAGGSKDGGAVHVVQCACRRERNHAADSTVPTQTYHARAW